YIARVFGAAVLAMIAALSSLVSLFDFIELLRRSATKPDATFGVVVQIAALRLPWIAMEILPFAVLLGGIVTATDADWERVRTTANELGQYASPDDCWLALRGARTLAVRLAHQMRAGLEVARWLASRP
ncbi:LptF/LptG family permease, partial [Staphylococcus aureus]